jgi:hypothetical protein
MLKLFAGWYLRASKNVSIRGEVGTSEMYKIESLQKCERLDYEDPVSMATCRSRFAGTRTAI